MPTPSKHALCSSSSAHRWLNCTAAPRFELNFPSSTSSFAEEGTLAHEFCELYARYKFGQLDKKKFNNALKKLQDKPYYADEMLHCAEFYADHLMEKANGYSVMPYTASEVHVDFSVFVPDGFGTCDNVMIGDDIIDITDYKHGKGVPVSPVENPQMKLYAIGAVEKYKAMYGDTIKRVRMAIVQPRITEDVHPYETTVEALYEWGRKVVQPAAQAAFTGNGAQFNPGDWCRFCRGKPAPEKPAVDKGGAPAGAEVTIEPSAPRDATRAEKEEIVYLNLSDLHPFKNHPFGVWDDAEMQGLVESVKAAGVNQPALVRPREDGGYEIIAGHRRQRASELAGFANMPCIVRNMTDDEAILAMTDDNLRHRERILPTEKAQSLKMQVEAIKHQGSRPGEEDKDAGKRSTQIVGDRNGMNYKQVQRYIRLTELVPDLQAMVDEKKLAFTPAVEISFIRPKHQKYIAVSIEGQQSSPSLSQAQKMRELDKEGKLNGDVIDGILSQEKKEVDKVIINSAELEKYFGKDKSPREIKDKIISLLDDWKAKQPPELGKPEKKTDLEK